jgi:hypothetical protein
MYSVAEMASFIYKAVPIVKVTLSVVQRSNTMKSNYPDIYYPIVFP